MATRRHNFSRERSGGRFAVGTSDCNNGTGEKLSGELNFSNDFLTLCPCLNEHPAWIEGMRALILEEGQGWLDGDARQFYLTMALVGRQWVPPAASLAAGAAMVARQAWGASSLVGAPSGLRSAV